MSGKSLAAQNPSAALSHGPSPIAVVDYGTSASGIEQTLHGVGFQQAETHGGETARLDYLLESDLASPGASVDSEYDEWAEGDQDNPAIGALRGEGLPRIAETHRGRTGPSEITDVATQVGANRRRVRTDSSLLSSTNGYDSSQGRLHASLFSALKRPPKERRPFLPSGQLERQVCEEAVVNELSKIEESIFRHVSFWKPTRSRETIVEEARKICGAPLEGADATQEPKRYKKIFTILLFIERPSRVRRFIREGVSDEDLPLVKHIRDDKPKTFKLRRKNAKDTPLRCFKGWRFSDVVRFEEWQWSLLAPLFRRSEPRRAVHYRFNESIILPFTESKKIGMPGGFGQVYKTWIDLDHHEFATSQNVFAVKALLSKDRAAFKREVQILKRLSRTHRHLISLLATYEQHGRFYLIFPWAEADLLEYWMTHNKNPKMNLPSIQWMVRQCEGIARGLGKIHRYETFSNTSLLGSESSVRMKTDSLPENEVGKSPNGSTGQLNARLNGGIPDRSGTSSVLQLFGRHGDIKPENILWFPNPRRPGDRGTLKITDFGTAEMNEHENPPRRRKNGVPNSPTYRPPEYDLGDGCLSPAYDIWTLGCLYLQFITWSLGGAEYLEIFADKRDSEDRDFGMVTDNFFTIVQDGETGEGTAIVKPAVTQFIRELHCHAKCTQFFHDFLRMIETGMLICQGNDCHPTSPRRISSNEIARRLDEMSKRCKATGYAVDPVPWEEEISASFA